eukprot:958432-Pleurochrysis_carterae.AAC.6
MQLGCVAEAAAQRVHSRGRAARVEEAEEAAAHPVCRRLAWRGTCTRIPGVEGMHNPRNLLHPADCGISLRKDMRNEPAVASAPLH